MVFRRACHRVFQLGWRDDLNFPPGGVGDADHGAQFPDHPGYLDHPEAPGPPDPRRPL